MQLRFVKKKTRHQTPLFEEKQFREAIVWAYYRRSDFQGAAISYSPSLCYRGFAQFFIFFLSCTVRHKANNIGNLNLPPRKLAREGFDLFLVRHVNSWIAFGTREGPWYRKFRKRLRSHFYVFFNFANKKPVLILHWETHFIK